MQEAAKPYRALVHLGVPEALLNWLHALAEQVHVELLKAGTSDAAVEVDTLVEGVNLDAGLGGGGQGPLGTLTGCPKPPEGSGIAGDVLLVLPLELLHDEKGITSCSFDAWMDHLDLRWAKQGLRDNDFVQGTSLSSGMLDQGHCLEKFS